MKRYVLTLLPGVLLAFTDAVRADLPPLPPELSESVPIAALALDHPEIPTMPGLMPANAANASTEEPPPEPPGTGTPADATHAKAFIEAAPVALEGSPVPLAPPFRLENANPPIHAAKRDDAEAPVTLDLRDASVPAALQAIARFTGLNLVVSAQVHGTVSLHLEQVPWRTAFDTVLDAHGLVAEQHGPVLFVAPAAAQALRARQRLENHAREAELEPLASRSFALHYAQAPELAHQLAGSGAQRVLSKRGAVLADARTNLLFVSDLPGRLEQISSLIERLDQPTRQVLIEARIVEGERGFSRNLGARLLARAAGSQAATSGTGSAVASTQAAGMDAATNNLQSSLAALPLAGFQAASAGFALFAASASRLLDLELSALESDGKGQIISSPRVVTADRVRALVEQGTELPYQAKVEQGVSGVQFRRVTLRLEVEPQITPDGHLILDLDIAKDSMGEETAGGPAINTRHVRTRVEIEDGGTVSIGGIYTHDARDDVTRVPLLGKIPVLGALFRHRARRETQGELVVYITPRVVSGVP